MRLNEYQRAIDPFAIYPASGEGTLEGLTYVTLGLVGEAGEFANKVKKLLRGDGTLEERRNLLIEELGDGLWYLTRCAHELGVSLDAVALINLQKLSDRRDRNVIKGDGDLR